MSLLPHVRASNGVQIGSGFYSGSCFMDKHKAAFNASSTADEVLEGIDLDRKSVV